MYAKCEGTNQYATNVREEFVQLDSHGRVLAVLNALAAEQLGHHGKRTFGSCRVCKGNPFEVTDKGTPRFHHVPSRFTHPR